MPSHGRTITLVVVLFLVVLTGCSGSGGSASGDANVSGASGGVQNSVGSGGADERQRAAQSPQAVIKTGRVGEVAREAR